MDHQYKHPEEMPVEESNDMDYTNQPEESQVISEDQVTTPIPGEFPEQPDYEIGN